MVMARTALVLLLIAGTVLRAQRPPWKLPERISAVVLCEDGTPIEGATLAFGLAFGAALEQSIDEVLERPHARSNREGRIACALPEVSPLRARVIVAAPGRIPIMLAVLAEGPDLELGPLVLYPGIELRGRVRDERGEAIAGVEIVAEAQPGMRRYRPQGLASPQWVTSTRTDEKGTFCLRGAPPVANVTFAKDGYAAQTIGSVRADTPLSPTMQHLGHVSGRLSGDWTGPATVHVVAEGFVQSSSKLAPVAADGTFSAPRRGAGRFRVVANVPGCVASPSPLFDTLPDEVVIAVQRAPEPAEPQRLKLTVLADGAPVAAFRVLRDTMPPTKLGALTWSEHGEEFPTPQQSLHFAAVGKDGVARIDLIQDSSPRFLVAADGRATTRVQFAPGAWEASCELGPGARLVGRVVQEEGQPIAGAHVFALRDRDGGQFRRTEGVRTDAGGKYEIGGLPAGRFLVQVDAAGFDLPDCPRADVDTGATATVADIVAVREQPLRGQLTGKGLARGSVVAVSNETSGPVDLEYLPSMSLAFALVDAQGRFDLPVRRAREEPLLLIQPTARWDGAPLVLPIGQWKRQPEPTQFDVDMVRLRTIRGRVLLPVGAASASDLRVVGANPKWTWASVYPPVAGVDADGNYELTVPDLSGWSVQVVDCALGLVVAVRRDTDQAEGVDIDLKLCTVTLKFVRPESDPTLAVTRLMFDSRRRVTWDGGAPAVAINDPRTATLSLALPRGDITLVVHNGFGQLASVSLPIAVDGPTTFDVPLTVPAAMK